MISAKVTDKLKRIVISGVLSITMAVASLTAFGVSAQASALCIIRIPGKYQTGGLNEAVKEINRLRKQACNNRIYSYRAGRKLTPDDYHPVEIDPVLMSGTAIRAAELTIEFSSWRLCDDSFLWMYPDNMEKNPADHAECILLNKRGSLVTAVNEWCKDKTSDTSCYNSLIDPEFRYIGLSAFTSSAINSTFTTGYACQLSSKKMIPENGIADHSSITSKKYIDVPCDVNSELIKGISIDKCSSVKKGKIKKLKAYLVMRCSLGNAYPTGQFRIMSGGSWKSSKKSVLKVDSNGKIKALKKGTSKITVRVGGKKKSIKISVK